MADMHELLTTVRDIYQKVSELYGLIKDREQDLVVVDKADSLMEDAKTDLLYLNDCIHQYGNEMQRPDQNTDFMHNKTSGSSHTSFDGTANNTTTKSTETPLGDEMKRQVENTMRRMAELLKRKNNSTDNGMGYDDADFDIL
ncbi:hypothetical protein KCU81_g8564, partial [Aureobasidium melanogenum]|uniref:Uncharacterized protein n=1 Tax=Aureobasidium melanogenum (strain CBS 110374) TaxID=1043003 RepID=A0A074W766_AURM1